MLSQPTSEAREDAQRLGIRVQNKGNNGKKDKNGKNDTYGNNANSNYNSDDHEWSLNFCLALLALLSPNRSPTNNIDTRILHPGSNAQDKGHARS